MPTYTLGECVYITPQSEVCDADPCNISDEAGDKVILRVGDKAQDPVAFDLAYPVGSTARNDYIDALYRPANNATMINSDMSSWESRWATP